MKQELTEHKLSRRDLLRWGVRGTVVCCSGALGSLAWASQAEPSWVQVTRHDVLLPHLPAEFDGMKVAHLTDIHIEYGGMAERFPDLCRMVTGLGADLICLTGDYISYRDNWQQRALYEGFRQLRAPLGVFAVMGNHDYMDDCGQSRTAMDRAGIRELRNEVVSLERDQSRFHVCGVEDMLVGAGDLGPVLAAVPSGQSALLLVHEPDFLDQVAATSRFQLMLSGHSHGGQVCLPGGGPIIIPPGAQKYPAGWYTLGDTRLYTNRGVGTVGVPVRFFCRPEVALFTLRSGKIES